MVPYHTKPNYCTYLLPCTRLQCWSSCTARADGWRQQITECLFGDEKKKRIFQTFHVDLSLQPQRDFNHMWYDTPARNSNPEWLRAPFGTNTCLTVCLHCWRLIVCAIASMVLLPSLFFVIGRKHILPYYGTRWLGNHLYFVTQVNNYWFALEQGYFLLECSGSGSTPAFSYLFNLTTRLSEKIIRLYYDHGCFSSFYSM